MFVRGYQMSDCKEITELFYNTVHTINAKDYTKEQLDVWATGQADLEKWNQSLQEHYSIVAIDNKIIVGFGDIDKDGYYTDASYVAENSSDGIYKVILNSYTENGYSDGMKLALKVNAGNSLSATYISINNLPKRPVYDLTHGTPISSGKFNKDTTYVFRYSAAKQGFYYLSSFQVHAVAIMTNGEIFKDYKNESECKAYYSSKYNTDNIVFVIDKNNKYCIENIGELIKSLKDNTYANLETDSIAANYAQAKLNQLCRRSTSLSLEMIIVPWLDVNQKIQYKPSDSDEVKTYITKSINGDLLSGTMSVSLIDFYATLDTE